MLTITGRAAEKLQHLFLNKCFETGMGFRLIPGSLGPGQDAFKIRLDRQHENDTIIDLCGVKLFVDSSSVAQLRNYQLDWLDKSDAGFYLEEISDEETEGRGNEQVEGVSGREAVARKDKE
jgi:Fe-S cluster assembly iron-binding protein IscA